MKKIVNKIAKVLQVILLAPVKLPNKALNVAKYIALGLGIVESVLEKDTDRPANEKTAASADCWTGADRTMIGIRIKKRSNGSAGRGEPMRWSDIKLSTIGGTICGVWALFSVGGLLYSALTALVGTLASFLLSRLLNRMFRKK